MSKDVEDTLIHIISKEANIDLAEAAVYLNRLDEEGRFAKDVY